MLPEARRGYPGYRHATDVPNRPAEPRFARSRNHAIAYDDVGRGPVVVLVAGFTMSGGDWWETGQVDRVLSLGRRVLVVDPLGHGQSDTSWDPGAYAWPGVALDILAAVDAAGVERAVFWGYSRGAGIVATIGEAAASRATGLVLGGPGDLAASPPSTLAPWQERMLTGDWAAYWETPFGAAYGMADRRYAEAVSDPRAFAAAQAGRRLIPYARDLSAVKAPALVYAGSNDDPDGAAATATALHAELDILPGFDHDGALIDVDQVMNVVAPFLERIAPTA